MTTRPYAKVSVRLDALDASVRSRVAPLMDPRHRFQFLRTEEADRAHRQDHVDLDHIYVDVVGPEGLITRLSLPTGALKHKSLT